MMNYEQMYKEALERAKNLYSQHEVEWCDEDIESIFPELKEIKNEEIPSLLHKLLCSEVTAGQFEKHGLTVDSALDWLEKQKPPKKWSQENIDELTHFESAMMHIGGSFFGVKAGLDLNNTVTIKEQAKLLLKLAPEPEWSEEEYHKAYYDGWNQCNIQHEHAKAEQKPAEWSEEDEELLANAIFFIREYQTPTRDKRMLSVAKEAEDWLQTLKQRVGGISYESKRINDR